MNIYPFGLPVPRRPIDLWAECAKLSDRADQAAKAGDRFRFEEVMRGLDLVIGHAMAYPDERMQRLQCQIAAVLP